MKERLQYKYREEKSKIGNYVITELMLLPNYMPNIS